MGVKDFRGIFIFANQQAFDNFVNTDGKQVARLTSR